MRASAPQLSAERATPMAALHTRVPAARTAPASRCRRRASAVVPLRAGAELMAVTGSAAALGTLLAAALDARLRPATPAFSADAASRELLALLLPPRAADATRIDELLDALTAAGSAFAPARLGGGPWRVVHTRGALAWRAFAPRFAAPAAAQAFDPVARTAVNSVTLLGGAVRITASGTFAVDDPSLTATPVRCTARIQRGEVAVGDELRLALLIAGEGAFEVCYVDQRLRIFRSPAGLAVQEPDCIIMVSPTRVAAGDDDSGDKSLFTPPPWLPGTVTLLPGCVNVHVTALQLLRKGGA